jgi:hypothetical protein
VEGNAGDRGATRAVAQGVGLEVFDEPVVVAGFESDADVDSDFDFDSDFDSDEPEESLDDGAGDVDDFLPRLSVLKKPDPLNVTPTGVKTFLTGNISPESGWAISVRLSSWKPCWTSIVSPVSTNL